MACAWLVGSSAPKRIWEASAEIPTTAAKRPDREQQAARRETRQGHQQTGVGGEDVPVAEKGLATEEVRRHPDEIEEREAGDSGERRDTIGVRAPEREGSEEERRGKVDRETGVTADEKVERGVAPTVRRRRAA